MNNKIKVDINVLYITGIGAKGIPNKFPIWIIVLATVKFNFLKVRTQEGVVHIDINPVGLASSGRSFSE